MKQIELGIKNLEDRAKDLSENSKVFGNIDVPEKVVKEHNQKLAQFRKDLQDALNKIGRIEEVVQYSNIENWGQELDQEQCYGIDALLG